MPTEDSTINGMNKWWNIYKSIDGLKIYIDEWTGGRKGWINEWMNEWVINKQGKTDSGPTTTMEKK